jgi:hypothetical protein
MMKTPKSIDEKWFSDPVLQAFADLRGVEFRPMFGGVAVYQKRGKQKAMLAYAGGTAKEEWRGLLVVTDYKHHETLKKKFPDLVPNFMLKKWLQISDEHPAFKKTLQGIYDLAVQASPLIGVVQKPRKRKTVAKKK